MYIKKHMPFQFSVLRRDGEKNCESVRIIYLDSSTCLPSFGFRRCSTGFAYLHCSAKYFTLTTTFFHTVLGLSLVCKKGKTRARLQVFIELPSSKIEGLFFVFRKCISVHFCAYTTYQYRTICVCVIGTV